jgi:hypothetical protein
MPRQYTPILENPEAKDINSDAIPSDAGSVLAVPALLGTGGAAGQRPSAGTKSGHHA